MNNNKQDFNELPIIFIHYGDSPYLEYTFKSTKIFNPTTRIILLGDERNQHYTDLGIEHFFFATYSNSQEFELFKNVYKFIAGSEHGKPQWTQFVFQRWFHIFEFIQSQGIERFWTFDSDTLIFADLQKYQSDLAKYDCTEQCNGSCMNGFVSSQKIVKGYLDTINNLFLDTKYLDEQTKSFIDNPNYAFTEMRAYVEYRNRNKLNTIQLQRISDEEIFDDCLCQPQGMEFINGQKKLFFRNGSLYQRVQDNQRLVRVNTINMSWTSIYLIEELFTYVVNNQLNRFPRSHLLIRCKSLFKKFMAGFERRLGKFLRFKLVLRNPETK